MDDRIERHAEEEVQRDDGQATGDEAFGTAEVVFESKVFLTAELKAAKLPIRLPSLPAYLKRYLRMSYVVAGTMTAGMVDCALVRDKQSNVR